MTGFIFDSASSGKRKQGIIDWESQLAAAKQQQRDNFNDRDLAQTVFDLQRNIIGAKTITTIFPNSDLPHLAIYVWMRDRILEARFDYEFYTGHSANETNFSPIDFINTESRTLGAQVAEIFATEFSVFDANPLLIILGQHAHITPNDAVAAALHNYSDVLDRSLETTDVLDVYSEMKDFQVLKERVCAAREFKLLTDLPYSPGELAKILILPDYLLEGHSDFTVS